MTPPIIDLLEDLGLVNESRIHDVVRKYKRRELSDLRERIYGALKQGRVAWDSYGDSLFNFFASSSLRGDSVCVHPRCRLSKISEVERFSSLYGDHTFIPISLGHSKVTDKTVLLGSLLLLSRLRPLIDNGFVVPIPEGLCLCKSCGERHFGEQSRASQMATKLSASHLSDIKVLYLGPTRRGRFTFQVSINDGLFEKTVRLAAYDERPDWLEGVSVNPGDQLQEKIVAKSGWGEKMYGGRLLDCVVQNYYAAEVGCSYLSDNHSEAQLFEAMQDEDTEQVSCVLEVVTAMAHEIPMFADFTTYSVVALRLEMPEAFSAYRSALSQSILAQKDLVNEGAFRAKQFYQDVLEPKVAALRSAQSEANKLTTKNLITGLFPAAALLSFGVFSGNTHGMSSILEAAGGASALNAFAEPFKERNKRRADVRKDSFFFLLEVERRWKSSLTCRQ